jgi:hypothetical protein
MTVEQIARLGSTVVALENVGLQAAGGIEALVKMFAPTHLSDAELNGFVDQVAADAARRRDERATMAGQAAPNPLVDGGETTGIAPNVPPDGGDTTEIK